MKLQIKQIKPQYDELRQPQLVLTLATNIIPPLDKLRQATAQNKTLDVDISEHKKKRSLDANSYAWVLITKIADVLRTSKEEVYIDMLKRYGQREPQLLSVVAEGVPMVYRATQNHCVEVGESELNGKLFKHIAILIGSSQYDTRQMAILIDGIVSECKELGIETMTPAELESLKEKWGKKHDSINK